MLIGLRQCCTPAWSLLSTQAQRLIRSYSEGSDSVATMMYKNQGSVEMAPKQGHLNPSHMPVD